MCRFADREHAGQVLAGHLLHLRTRAPVVLGLLRGGAPVGAALARALDAPFGPISALRIHVPGEPERTAGAVAPGVRYFNRELIAELGISDEYLRIAAEAREIELLARVNGLTMPDITGRTVIIVDDGIASGATLCAAAQWARQEGADTVIAAAPVATRAGLASVRFVDDVIVPCVLDGLRAISHAYKNFTQL